MCVAGWHGVGVEEGRQGRGAKSAPRAAVGAARGARRCCCCRCSTTPDKKLTCPLLPPSPPNILQLDHGPHEHRRLPRLPAERGGLPQALAGVRLDSSCCRTLHAAVCWCCCVCCCCCVPSAAVSWHAMPSVALSSAAMLASATPSLFSAA